MNISGLCEQEISSFYFYNNTRKFNIYITIVIIIVGLLGNGLAVFVFAQKRFRRHSSSIYLLCLCLSDGLFLMMHFFEDTLRTYIDVYMRPVADSISENCHPLLSQSEKVHYNGSLLLILFNITDRFALACKLVNFFRYFLR